MTKALAEGILALTSHKQMSCADELNAKANDGTLAEHEQIELEAYVGIADILAYWQAKARQSFRHS